MSLELPWYNHHENGTRSQIRRQNRMYKLIDTQAVTTVKTRSRKAQITVELAGICDIFDVDALKSAFAKALENDEAKNILIDCRQLVRLDTSTAQLVAAVTLTALTCGKTVQLLNVPPQVAKYLAKGGLQF